MRGSVSEAAAAMGGRVVTGDGAGPQSDRHWSGAAIDSRKLRGGELFFALPGENTDGHRFVAAAAAMGAAACVVHHDLEPPAGTALVRVDDTYRALHALVRHLRHGEGGRPLRPRNIVGITGSTGKTTTKELTAAMLGRRYRVARNEGNLNNLFGFPLSLLNVPDDTEWMVAEMGMSSAGELSQLTALARPEAVIYTNVRPVHLEFFDSVRGIAEAKAELLEGLVPGGLVVANADDPEVTRFVRRFAAVRREAGEPVRVVWYGRGGEGGDGEAKAGKTGTAGKAAAQVRAARVAPAGPGEPGSRFELLVDAAEESWESAGGPGGGAGGSVDVHLPLHGAYNVDNALAAAAAAWALGVPLAEIAAAAAGARSVAGRGAVHRLDGEITVIDDSYNSNPEALRLALDSAAELQSAAELPGRRRWAVLGDMLELGPEAPSFHRECGRHAAEKGFAPVVGVGELSREIVAGADEADGAGRWFATAAEAADFAAGELAPGDVVLVKASRGVGLDAVVERLVARAGEAGDDGATGGGG